MRSRPFSPTSAATLPGEVSYAAYLEQIAELDQISEAGRWDRTLAPDLENGSGHPAAAIRIRELTTWADSDAFRRLARTPDPAHTA
jgi:hypothetical protein